MTGLAYLTTFMLLAVAGRSWASVIRKPVPRHRRAGHTGDLFGRAGATRRASTFTGATITNLESDWPSDDDIEAADWECCWARLDSLLSATARAGDAALVAAGVPRELLAAVSLAEVQRHERATVHASELVPA